jgi:pyruvate formate lyase activating enzyme
MKIPYIVDIKENSLDDGVGIRSVIFFKGCPLTCVWCQNPEAQSPNQELVFESEKCIKCSPSCYVQCPTNAFNYDMMTVNRKKCTLSWNCVQTCPANVFSIAGQKYEIKNLIQRFESNKIFYQNSGGGITLSGGEPMIYPEYVLELIKGLQEIRLQVAIETCGLFKWDEISREILRQVQHIYFDMKIIDPVKHAKYCGVSNKQIVENLEIMIKEKLVILPVDKKEIEKPSQKPYLIPRIPLIPDIVMNTQNLSNIAQFLRKLHVKVIDLLPYNPLWSKKSYTIGKDPKYIRDTWLKPEEKSYAAQFFQDFLFDSFKI